MAPIISANPMEAPMKERPILFSGPMVRALLDGRKTQTRRAIKLPTKGEYHRPDMGGWAASTVGGAGCYDRTGSAVAERACIWNQTTGTTLVCPYGEVGDALWVRETCAAEEREDGLDGVRYWADEAWAPIENTAAAGDRWLTLFNYGRGPRSDCIGPSIPAIHMPRWASRLVLELVSVRVERLQDISEADALAEGIQQFSDGFHWEPNRGWPGEPPGMESARFVGHTAKQAYFGLWEAINGRESLDANPWVWVVEFQRLDATIAAAA